MNATESSVPIEWATKSYTTLILDDSGVTQEKTHIDLQNAKLISCVQAICMCATFGGHIKYLH